MSAISISLADPKNFWSISNQAIGSEWWDLVKGIFTSISNRETQRFPYAHLNQDGSVSFLLPEADRTGDFAQKLSHQNILNQIDYYRALDGMSTIDKKPLSEIIPHDETELIEYRFNLTPDQLDTILKRNYTYTGYKGENSLLKLNKTFDLSGDTIRLFPVYPISEGKWIIRAAGCQMTETISVQLLRLLPGGNSKTAHLHHVHGRVEKSLSLPAYKIMGIVNKILQNQRMLNKYIHVESDRMYAISAPNPELADDLATVRIAKMTPDTQILYQMYGNCSQEELKHCDSLEVTKEVFIKFALEKVKDESKHKALQEL